MPPWGCHCFHTSFNVLNVVILFAFVPYIVRLIERLLPDNGPQDDQYQLKYISLGVMTSPGLSVEQAQKEIQNFAEIIEKMHGLVDELLFDPQAPREKLLERIHAYEETTDQLEMEISDYLVSITENTNLEHELTERMRFMQTMINDMERIADIYFQVSKLSDRMLEAKTNWPEEANNEMQQMMTALRAAIHNMRLNVARDAEDVDLRHAIKLEDQVDDLRDEFRDNHYARLENGAYSPRAGVTFIDILNRLERIGDHVLNVNESSACTRLKAKRIPGKK